METKQDKNIIKDVTIMNPLQFKSFLLVKEYIYSLKLDEAKEFNKLILSLRSSFEKYRDYIYQTIRIHILESNKVSAKEYKRMLKLLYELGIWWRYKYATHCCGSGRFDCFWTPSNIKDLRTRSIKHLNKLIKIDQKNRLFSNGLVNRLNAFANVLINYSNYCNKTVFGNVIDESFNILKIPTVYIGKCIDGNWDMKSCIGALKKYLISCMFKKHKGNMGDLIKIIKKDYKHFGVIEAWSFYLTTDDANRIWKRLSA